MLQFQKHLKLLLIIVFQCALISCATGAGRTPMYFNQLFRFYSIDKDVDILDYAYGVSKVNGTYVSERERRAWGVFNQTYVIGPMPRGNFLYVKWRLKSTGKVYEDRVDLTHKLPLDMEDYGLYFLVAGSQLHVFLFPPDITKDVFGKEIKTVGMEPVRSVGKTLLDMPEAMAHQIYPDSVN